MTFLANPKPEGQAVLFTRFGYVYISDEEFKRAEEILCGNMKSSKARLQRDILRDFIDLWFYDEWAFG